MTQSSDKEVGAQGTGQSKEVNQPSHTEGKSVQSEYAHLGQGGGGAGRPAEEGNLGNQTENASNGQESSGG